jgi:hypothetical protein
MKAFSFQTGQNLWFQSEFSEFDLCMMKFRKGKRLKNL